jgi:hypothetical protein
MELSNIILDIKNNYNGIKKQVIYLGVGTAAGYREPDGTLLEKNYHQYPPFLQNLKNSIQDVHMSIILIDPYQEDPPYMVKDKGLSIKDKGLICNINNNTFISLDQSLIVYTWREDVRTEPYEDVRGIDITSHLRELNKYAIDSGCIFIYHNFTGRNNRILAEFFDEELKDHLDHIIYGLGLREDFGCYFDLTDLCSYHPFYIDSHNHIKLFNVYDYIINGKLNFLKSDIAQKFNNDNNVFNSHMEKMLHIVKHELNNVALQSLRVVFRLITGEEIKPFDDNAQNFNCFDSIKRNICLNFITDKNYTGLYDLLLTEFGKKLDIVAIFKGLDLTGREILEFITLGDDPFDWYNNVKHFL